MAAGWPALAGRSCKRTYLLGAHGASLEESVPCTGVCRNSTRPPRARSEARRGSSRCLRPSLASQALSSRHINIFQFISKAVEQFLSGIVQVRVVVSHIKPLAGKFEGAILPAGF